MFSSLEVRNVQEAYVRGLAEVRATGQLEETRNGPALVIPWPVVTVYERPYERVMLDPQRDANPFFHLMEGIWMLAGRNDVDSIGRFLGSLKKYSDDGTTYHGAYGHRWRQHFCDPNYGPLDQLARVVELLRANPGDRRVVLQMWDPETDLGREGKDFPCNTQCLFRVRRRPGGGWNMGVNDLDMTVFNRSNDLIWGAYGANAVHFSILQEFVAAAIGCSVGHMYQWSNNLHAYCETLDRVGEPGMYTRRDVGGEGMPLIGLTMYDGPNFRADPIFTPSSKNHPVEALLEEIERLWDEKRDGDYYPAVFTPRGLRTLELVRDSYLAYKAKEYDVAHSLAGNIPHSDWRRACVEWLERRAASRAAKAGD